MTNVYVIRYHMNRIFALVVALCLIIITTATVFGHGGKHSDKFTQLKALQKATELYDQLITNQKLDQSWETGLQSVSISKRKNNEEDEFVVSFHRKEGDPKSVYIFFTPEGKYSGSNFTGK